MKAGLNLFLMTKILFSQKVTFLLMRRQKKTKKFFWHPSSYDLRRRKVTKFTKEISKEATNLISNRVVLSFPLYVSKVSLSNSHSLLYPWSSQRNENFGEKSTSTKISFQTHSRCSLATHNWECWQVLYVYPHTNN